MNLHQKIAAASSVFFDTEGFAEELTYVPQGDSNHQFTIVAVVDWDNEEGTMHTFCEVAYTCEEGYTERIQDSCLSYTCPGQLYVEDVHILFVEYYNPHGDLIARIMRENIGEEALIHLTDECIAYVEGEVDNNGALCEDLWEHR